MESEKQWESQQLTVVESHDGFYPANKPNELHTHRARYEPYIKWEKVQKIMYNINTFSIKLKTTTIKICTLQNAFR